MCIKMKCHSIGLWHSQMQKSFPVQLWQIQKLSLQVRVSKGVHLLWYHKMQEGKENCFQLQMDAFCIVQEVTLEID